LEFVPGNLVRIFMQASTGRTATQTQPLRVNGRDWAGIPSASRRT
jgi:hypothetical protein